jgi:hypothetical protein
MIWVWWCIPVIPSAGSINRTVVKASPSINVRPCLKNNQRRKGWSMTQMVEYLPSKPEALNSNPHTTNKNIIK